MDSYKQDKEAYIRQEMNLLSLLAQRKKRPAPEPKHREDIAYKYEQMGK